MTINIVICIIAFVIAFAWLRSRRYMVTPVAVLVMLFASASTPLQYAGKAPAVLLFGVAVGTSSVLALKWWKHARPMVMKFIDAH